MSFKLDRKNIEKIIKATQLGLIEATETLKKDSNDIAPQDEGELIRSSDVTFNKDKSRGRVTYDTPYAKRLHEHPEYNFSKDKNPKAQGEYLRKPSYKEKKYQKIIANEIKKVLR